MSDIINTGNDHHSSIEPRSPGFQRLTRWAGVILIAIALLATFYGAIIYLGWQSGVSIRRDKIETERTASLLRQKELAVENISQSQFELAMRRLDYVLLESPNDPDALALRSQAEIGWSMLLTPSPTMTPTPTQTPTPTATPTLAPAEPTPDATAAIQAAADAYAQLQDDLAAGGLAQDIVNLESFRAEYTSYERRTVDEKLYDAYVAYGLSLTRGNEVERGLGYLYQARDLRDLPEDVQGEIFWAEQYLDGIVYYGINWDAYFSYFRPLCDFVPNFQDSCGKLQVGLINAAWETEQNLDWCVAVTLYEEAIRVKGSTSEILEKVKIAQEACDLATPTPELLGSVTPDPNSEFFFVTPDNLTLPGDSFTYPLETPTPTRP